MAIEKTKIVEILSKIKAPNSDHDLVSMNMIHELKIDGNNVNFSLRLPTLGMPGKSELNFACMASIQEVYPQANVNVHLFAQSQQSQQSTSTIPHVKNIIAVASGKGGVGKSTVSTNLALALKEQGARVGLIDADLYGPSIPTMLGLKGQRPKVQDQNGQPKILPLEAYGIPVMSIGFIIEPEQAVVLRGPRLGAIIRQFFNDCVWPPLDYLIVDLPPGTGDIQLTLVQTVPVTGSVIVTTPQEVAVVDAIKAMNMFLLPSVNVPILGVVENMSWFTPEELPDNKYFIFGEGGGSKLAELSESTLLGQIPLVQGIREAGDGGQPIVLHQNHPMRAAFLELAKNTMERIENRNSSQSPTQRVDVKL